MTADARIEELEEAAKAPRSSPPQKTKFAQVYPKGWQTIRSISENSMALKVYSFIAEHCDHLNALVCSIDVMADEFNVNERTIRRATKWLEDNRHLVIIKVGTANAYVLNPQDIWKNYERYKGYCAFHASTLASKKHNKLLKQRLTHMMEGQGDLFAESEKM
jgi:hypothetical protein